MPLVVHLLSPERNQSASLTEGSGNPGLHLALGLAISSR